LFRYNTLASVFTYCFSGCDKIAALPANLILYNTKVTSYANMFKTCTALASGSGVDFVTQAEANAAAESITLTTTDCFDSCTNLPDYADIPAGWK